MHAATHPNARGTIVNIPPVAEPRGTVAAALPSVQTQQINEDLLGIFDSMAVSTPATSNPFDFASKPDPPEVTVSTSPQAHAVQQGPGPASSAPIILGSAQAPIPVDTLFQPTVVPIPAQPYPAVNQAGIGYTQSPSQPFRHPGQGQQYSGYPSQYNQGQGPPQYQVPAGHVHGVQQSSQQQAPSKTTNPFDPFA